MALVVSPVPPSEVPSSKQFDSATRAEADAVRWKYFRLIAIVAAGTAGLLLCAVAMLGIDAALKWYGVVLPRPVIPLASLAALGVVYSFTYRACLKEVKRIKAHDSTPAEPSD